MKFKAILLVVKNIDVSRNFYEVLLNQKTKYDFGECITYEGDFSIQQKKKFRQLTGISKKEIGKQCNNAELYFETEDINALVKKLSIIDNIEYIHPLIEHEWGQQVIRFYDPDGHIIEVGESMETVIRRFLQTGMTVAEVAIKTQHPITMVEKVYKEMEE